MLLKKAIDQFEVGYFSTRHRSERTLKAYSGDLAQFLGFSGRGSHLEKIRPEKLEQWALSLQNQGLAPASIRRKFATLRVFFSYWVRKQRLEVSPLWHIRLDLAKERVLPRILTEVEVSRIIQHAQGAMGSYPRRWSTTTDSKFLALRNLAIVELLFATGIRVGELTGLTMRDFLPEEGTLLINGKGRRQRTAFLPDPRSAKAIVSYRDHRIRLYVHTNALFVNVFGEALSSQGVANVVTNLARDAGVKTRVTPHVFRHTIATMLLQRGLDIRLVQEFLGHSSIATTQRYTHVSKEWLSNSIRSRHPNCLSLVAK